MSEEAMAQALLQSMGVDRYEGRVVGVVLEHMHRSVQSILMEAREVAMHAGRDRLEVNDIELVDDLAAEDGYCASPLPSRETMFELARACNAQPFVIPDGHGLRLPPRESQLTGQCYQFVPKDLQKEDEIASGSQEAKVVAQSSQPPGATSASSPAQQQQAMTNTSQPPPLSLPPHHLSQNTAGSQSPIVVVADNKTLQSTAALSAPETSPMALDQYNSNEA